MYKYTKSTRTKNMVPVVAVKVDGKWISNEKYLRQIKESGEYVDMLDKVSNRGADSAPKGG